MKSAAGNQPAVFFGLAGGEEFGSELSMVAR